jgi:hypothetical protein
MNNELTDLSGLVQRIRGALEAAETNVQILGVRADASIAYEKITQAERLAKARHAHGETIAALRAMAADMLLLEAGADIRLANEYDAAQARGELQSRGGDRVSSKVRNADFGPTVSDMGISKQRMSEARQLRDAEKAKPGSIKRALDAEVQAGRTPTRAAVKRAIKPEPVIAEPVRPEPAPIDTAGLAAWHARRDAILAAAETEAAKVLAAEEADFDYDAGPDPEKLSPRMRELWEGFTEAREFAQSVEQSAAEAHAAITAGSIDVAFIADERVYVEMQMAQRARLSDDDCQKEVYQVAMLEAELHWHLSYVHACINSGRELTFWNVIEATGAAERLGRAKETAEMEVYQADEREAFEDEQLELEEDKEAIAAERTAFALERMAFVAELEGLLAEIAALKSKLAK